MPEPFEYTLLFRRNVFISSVPVGFLRVVIVAHLFGGGWACMSAMLNSMARIVYPMHMVMMKAFFIWLSFLRSLFFVVGEDVSKNVKGSVLYFFSGFRRVWFFYSSVRCFSSMIL